MRSIFLGNSDAVKRVYPTYDSRRPCQQSLQLPQAAQGLGDPVKPGDAGSIRRRIRKGMQAG